MNKDRFQRQNPQRDRPNRATSHHLRLGNGRPAQASQQADGGAPAGNPPHLDAIISDAVGLGYRVIDEQIRQGRAAAERLRTGILATEAPSSDVSATIERAASLSMELAATWLELLSAFGGAVQQVRPAAQRAGTRWPPVAPVTEHEVNCPRENMVDVHFNPTSSHFVPRVHPLHAADPNVPPLTDVHFTLSPDKRRAVLHIPVPDQQPSGTYSGTIVDAATNQVGGTLVVRLS